MNHPAVLRDIHHERGATVLVAILAVVVPGLVLTWGDNRSRHLSLDWDDIARVRVWPNPIQLGDTGLLVFDPVAGHGVTHRAGPVQRLRDRIFRAEYGSKFVVSTWSTDWILDRVVAPG